MKISADWLKKNNTQRLFQTLREAGHQAFAVGGCVRNAILGLEAADVDISTDAKPDQVQSLFARKVIKTLPTGLEHGTVTAIIDSQPFEITSFRKDVATDGRRAIIAFAETIVEDAMRRDFTMNALYIDQDGMLHDPLDGLPDLQARLIRFVGDADQRIAEDYLRILRFFRFNAYYGDLSEGFDPDGLAACAAGAEGLLQISKERITQELCKLLAANDPAPVVGAMVQAGVMIRVLSGINAQPLAPLVHFENGTPSRWQLRLAALVGEADLSELRLSKSDARLVMALREAAQSSEPPHALGFRLGADMAKEVLLLRSAFFEQAPEQNAQEDIDLGAGAKLPLVAGDLPSTLEGPAIGAALRSAQASWINSRFTLSKQDLLDDLG